jgi:Zn-dependent metalloprotease
MRKPSVRRLLLHALLIGSLLGGSAVQAQIASGPARTAVQEMGLAAGVPVTARFSETTGLVTFLRTDPGAPIPLSAAVSGAEARAWLFLSDYGSAFLESSLHDLEVTSVGATDGVGMERVRFRQTYQGVPVTGGEVSVHLRGDAVRAVHAKTVVGLAGISVAPVFPAAEAEAAAAVIAGRRYSLTAAVTPARLELLNRGLLEGRQTETRLAWFIEATGPRLRDYVWIDAQTGDLLLQIDQLTHAKDREIYDADDPGDGVYDELPGDLVRSEGEGATSDTDTDLAYEYSGDTYDYFFTEHGRDSFDDLGGTLISTVHFCPSAESCPFLNAFWDGTQMVYGEGYAAADDVAAHELTHAVTDYTADLYYYMQSGALNESFSDIFGETVDLLNGSGTDTSDVRWMMGEDVPGSGAIRDMEDPTTFGDPGKMSDAQFYCDGSDVGGVHSNSGVPNHAYSLMVDGGTYNSFSVSGIGLTKAGKIEYRVLSEYLLTSSDFRDDYDALQAACEDLIGTAGITAGDCTEVTDALDAVEMGDSWACTSPAPQAEIPPLCPGAAAPSLLADFDWETFIGLADCSTGGYTAGWCVNGPTTFLGPFNTSPEHSVWGYSPSDVGAYALTLDTTGSLPAGTFAQFNHSFGFDDFFGFYYDGGLLQYSTNDGSSWSDANSLVSAGMAYNGTITSAMNPADGLAAFVGDSWGFTATRLDLSSFAGSEVDYRFIIATDEIVDDYGWFMDDLRLYTCPVCPTSRTLTSAYNGTEDVYTAASLITAGSGFEVGPTEVVTLLAPAVVFEDGFSVRGDFTVELGNFCF